ncbi:MAG: glycosyltransferase [Bacilli bacterium]|jgi:glycosyltransferase involved in cell wall biosynthesis
MKILLINVVYNKGSTGVIVNNLYDYYSVLGHEVSVAYGRGQLIKEKDIYKVGNEFEANVHHFFSKITGNMYGGMLFSTNKLIKIIQKIEPDIVHIHCINGYFTNIYRLIKFIKINKLKVVLTNHSDFMFTANCGYSLWCDNWKNKECRGCPRVKEFNGPFSLNRTHSFYIKMKKAFEGMTGIHVTGVSPWLTDRVKQSPIFSSFPISTVLNGVSLELTNIRNEENPYTSVNPLNKKIVLYVTANFDEVEKGGSYIFEIAKLCPEEIFVVIGSTEKKIIENIIFVGRVKSSDLAKYYYYADASLLLSKRETFSMVVAESLICGTPVVGFLSGGPEAIAIKEYSSFVENGDVSSLVASLNKVLMTQNDKHYIMKMADEKYSVKASAEEYLNIYQRISNEK